MNIKRILYALIAGLIILSSCDNDYPTFNDVDACVGFSIASYSIGEADGKIEIPVYLASVAGITGTAEIDVDIAHSTAIEGEDFSIVSKELSFSTDGRIQNFVVNILDNNIFTGDKKVVFNIVSSSVNLAVESVCTLTIIDDEHPLKGILNTYVGKIEGSESEYNMEIVIEKDEGDLAKVWISNLDPYFAAYGYTAADGYNKFYGIVNSEKTEIAIPVGQATGYEDVKLEGLDGPDPNVAELLAPGSSIIIKIVDNGASLEIPNGFGVANGEGFWEYYKGGAKLLKH